MTRKEGILELATQMKADGFEVWLSDNGEYGFFTNEEGNRVVYFQLGYTSWEVEFSGCLSGGDRNSGTGWKMDATNYKDAWEEAKNPPSWYRRYMPSTAKYATRETHLRMFSASKYTKF